MSPPPPMSDTEMIADERSRIIRLEEKLEMISTISKGIWTLVVLFLVNAFGGIYAFSQLSEKVNSLELDKMQQNISTALTVLADHGTEISVVRQEHQRIRGNIDAIQSVIDKKTKDRFYKHDGDRMEGRIDTNAERILRLEEVIFFRRNQVKPETN